MQIDSNYSSHSSLIIPSILAFNTLNHIHFVSSGAKALLKVIISSLRLKDGGHNLSDVKYFCNAELALKLGVSKETVRKRKEELHAHNVILIDTRTYDAYLVKDETGVIRRYKPDQVQSVSLTPEFANFMSLCAKNKKVADTSPFSPNPIWTKKVADWRSKNLIAVAKHWVNKLGITLGISCEDQPIKLDTIHKKDQPIKLVQNINNNRKTIYEDSSKATSSPGYCLSSEKKSIEEILNQSSMTRSLLNSQACKNIVKKPFTLAVKTFCDKLFAQGMDLKTVACTMIEQRYASTVEDFKLAYYRCSVE